MGLLFLQPFVKVFGARGWGGGGGGRGDGGEGGLGEGGSGARVKKNEHSCKSEGFFFFFLVICLVHIWFELKLTIWA